MGRKVAAPRSLLVQCLFFSFALTAFAGFARDAAAGGVITHGKSGNTSEIDANEAAKNSGGYENLTPQEREALMNFMSGVFWGPDARTAYAADAQGYDLTKELIDSPASFGLDVDASDNDQAGGCSAAPLSSFAALAVLALLRRRRRSGSLDQL